MTENETKILVARLSDVENDKSYLREFTRLYGNVLKERCSQRPQRKGETKQTPLRINIPVPRGY